MLIANVSIVGWQESDVFADFLRRFTETFAKNNYELSG